MTFARRAIAVVTAIAFAFGATGCAKYRWRAVPLTDVSLAKEKIESRTVRFTTDDGVVTLDVRRIEFPWVHGVPKAGEGRVSVDLLRVRQAAIVELAPSSGKEIRSTVTSLAEEAVRGGSLDGRLVRFETGSGQIMLAVDRVAYPIVRGRPREVTGGEVQLDLRTAQRMEIHEVDGGKTALVTIGAIGGVLAALLIIVALTKESCPFVYVDRGQGWELVGEAYAGAAFRSIQRDDLLPLPTLAGGRARIRLRNEARETQYTDRAALILADHDSGTRVLSTFDGRLVLVGAPIAAASARDLAGRPAADLLATRDERLWQTDLAAVVADPRAPLAEGLEASFPLPDRGAPILELVGGNTPWLDLVFGRFFAAMGDRLPKYIASGNDSSAGDRIRSWRARQGVDLTVEVLEQGAWRKVATLPTVGPAAQRHVAVPLPRGGEAGAGVETTVRLRGGLGFWRIDQLTLSIERDGGFAVEELTPVAARGRNGGDERAAVATVDGTYNALEVMDEAIDLDFELPPLAEGRTRSAFLLTTGYYNVHTPIQGQWSPGTLRAIRSEPDGLSRLSRDLAREYLRIARRAAPAPPATATGGTAR